MALPPRRPLFSAREQDFDVEPGTLRYGVGGKMQDYSDFRPTNMEPQPIPDSLRGRSYLRPLLQAQGDNGGPLSLADMEANSRAMDALDEHFQLRPSAKAAELMALEAETAKNEELAQDPLYFERGKMDLDMQRRFFELDQKAKMDREAEAGRRDAFGGEMQRLESDAQAEIQAALAEGDTAGAEAIKNMLDTQRQLIREKHGIGAKLGAAGLYDSTPRF